MRAKFGVTGNQRVVAAEQHGLVAMMQGLNLQDGIGRKIFQENSALNLGPNDAAVHFVAQMWMRRKHVSRPKECTACRSNRVHLRGGFVSGSLPQFSNPGQNIRQAAVSRGTKVV